MKNKQSGFTLIELTIVIVVISLLATIAYIFVPNPVKSLISVEQRAQLTTAIDNSTRLISREVKLALPNSIRVSADGLSMEFIPTSDSGSYFIAGLNHVFIGGSSTGPMTVNSATSVNLASGTTNYLVVNNLGTGVPESDAYAPISNLADQTVANRRTITLTSTNKIYINSLIGISQSSAVPPYRFYVVRSPITYQCDLANGKLNRTTDYGFLANQNSSPTGFSSTVIDKLTDCKFIYDSAAIAQRDGLLSMKFTASVNPLAPAGSSDSVSLLNAVTIYNQP